MTLTSLLNFSRGRTLYIQLEIGYFIPITQKDLKYLVERMRSNHDEPGFMLAEEPEPGGGYLRFAIVKL